MNPAISKNLFPVACEAIKAIVAMVFDKKELLKYCLTTVFLFIMICPPW